MRKRTQKVPQPDYATDKPHFPALRNLNEELGFQDAAIQLAELATQILAEQASKSGFEIGEFLRQEFGKRSIPQGTRDLSHLVRFSHQSYIVETYSIVEKILRQLCREVKAHKWLDEVWRSTDSAGEVLSPLVVLTENLPEKGAKLLHNKPEFDLLEYYRLLRVSIVHRTDETSRKASEDYGRLREAHGDYFSTTYSLEAPSSKENLSFADFLLFTRATKYFSNVLNEACDLQVSDIQMYVKLRDPCVLKILTEPKDYQVGALRSYVQEIYGLSSSDLSSFDQSIVLYLRERGEVVNCIKDINSKNRLYQVSFLASRDGTLTVKRVQKNSGSDGVPEMSTGLTLDTARVILTKMKANVQYSESDVKRRIR